MHFFQCNGCGHIDTRDNNERSAPLSVGKLPANVRYSGAKRTWAFALHMSAFDPKRTSADRRLKAYPSPFGVLALSRYGALS